VQIQEKAMTALSPEERKSRILDRVRAEGRLVAAELAQAFGTSEDTVRRDLRDLAAAGLIRRFHGGALPASPSVGSFASRARRSPDAKAALAEKAAALIRDGQTVLFDGGSTTLAVARALPSGIAVTAVTPSPAIALALADHPRAEVILIGGRLDKESQTVSGAAAYEAVRAVHADICLLGVCGLDSEIGVTAGCYEEARVKRAMVENSDAVIAVVTADKMGTAAPHLVGPITLVSRVLTERSAPDAVCAAIAGHGIEVVRV
jgi:DeoR/GlpR family transcriptional regulator of sugar metabolism